MATIQISDLHPVGSERSQQSEEIFISLSKDEVEAVFGGGILDKIAGAMIGAMVVGYIHRRKSLGNIQKR